MTDDTRNSIANEKPLESWKEIAAYIQRDVRTAKRWEMSEGLPVHRHHHLSRSSVYAYPSELEAWRAHREPAAESRPSTWWRPIPAFASLIVIALSLLMAGSGPQAGTVGQAVASPSEGGLQGRRIIGPSYHLRVGVSRDGRYVAYCCTMVHEVATGRAYSVKGLRLGGTYTQAPRFSPDSEDIAYVGQESGERPPELRAVKRIGSDERVLFSSPDVQSISLIDWMPDGKNLLAAFTRVDKTTELALVPVAGGEPRRIKSPAPSSDGRLSPDGRLFAYRVQLAGAGGAWITRMSVLDGSLDAPLVERPTNASNIGWTQDGRFVFLSDEGGSRGIWAVRVAEGKARGLPERVVPKIEESTEPVGLTPDGAFFYYRKFYDFQLHLMEVAPGAGSLKPSRVLAASHSPDWSPDGRDLAYARNNLISIRTLATGEERTLWTGLGGFVMSLRWLPDRRALAAQGVGPERASIGLYRVDLTSGSMSDILVGQGWGEFGRNPTFFPDGKVVTYKAFDHVRQVSTLTRHNLETHQQEVLVERKPPQYVSAFSVLPHTGEIAVAFQEGDGTSSVQLLDTASRELRSIYITPRGYYVPAANVLHWMPDGKSLLLVTAPSATRGSPMSMLRIPVSGGRSEKLFEAETIFNVRVHPDGRLVAIDTRSFKMETWVVDNLFTAKR